MLKFLQEIGIDIAILIAGLSGGLVSLRKDEKLSTKQKILTVLSGGLIATYLTPIFLRLAEKLIGTDTKIEYGLAFVIGYMGLKAIELLITKLFKQKDNESNGID